MSVIYRRFLQYFAGLTFSLMITGLAFYLSISGEVAGLQAAVTLGGLALLQLMVQLIFFLHLHEKGDARQRLLIFGFTTGILLIIVVGTIWIMYHLNYNMMEMTPDAKENYMTSQKDKGF